ncbi:NRDE family protein [Noviherbaspirillum denitrificans]|uniref:NRDE family protein n=1 Tax=Noviherbaspirillum denitrificans TaxID=1968433 RepID=A0A254TBI9_9BURK|nr:NRDE family protein [Noviherbaspirillum denitrificans]OWW20019.1 hypothetical protein AYR66_11455 [Noviherbaspirillum denitrificans]
MCLIVFAWKLVPGIPLLAAGNRDEFYERPTTPAGWWSDQAHIYAGRDLRGGGTWMGVTREGRFAAITNIREPSDRRSDAPSRGELVAGYLAGIASPMQFVEDLAPRAKQYNGFNLLVGNREELVWYSNGSPDDARNGKPLAPGVYGLSNGSLDTPWPKVVRTKAQFSSLLCQGAPEDAYFEMLSDTARAPDCRLPDTGIGQEWERILSAVCIESPEYGTRSSTVVRLPGNGTPILQERVLR